MRHRQTKEAATDRFEPTATAPHLDSTDFSQRASARKSKGQVPSNPKGACNGRGCNPAESPWNKGKLIGQKAPFKLREIWAIRVRLQIYSRTRELALFDLGIDSKLRACDLVKFKVRDISHGGRIATRAIVVQKKPPDRCNSKSQSRRASLWTIGSSCPACARTTISSQAASVIRPISAPGNTPGLSTPGSRKSALIRLSMELIRIPGD